MEEAELCRLAACLHAGGTRTLGLGMSLGDLCMDEGFYPAVFAQLAAAAARLREKSGLTVRIFDLGGGFGVSCRPDCPGPDLSACAEARRALASGAELFIGGHGGAAGADAVRFKIDYLECVKRLLAANGTADEFAHALRAAYPELPGEAGLDALAQALYADR